jgi:cyclophilin family peptidyl-prolyl cis-trans isomerase
MSLRVAFALMLFAGCTCTPGSCAGPTPANTPAPHSVVVIKTTQGEITVELENDKAPATVANFLKYVNEKFYDGTVFHRVINGFMIQGGGFDTNLKQKLPHSSVKNESSNGLKNLRGTIAMARTQDPDSATSQFFINVSDNSNLDYPKHAGSGYTVFGKVISGMDVVDRIKAVETRTYKGESPPVTLPNNPVTPVVIESVRLK